MTVLAGWEAVEPRSDGELALAAAAGDRSAFACIYDRYAHRLHDFCVGMLGDREAAADCVQDAFCTAVTCLSDLREPDKLRPWLYAIVRSEALRRIRHTQSGADHRRGARAGLGGGQPGHPGRPDGVGRPGRGSRRRAVRSRPLGVGAGFSARSGWSGVGCGTGCFADQRQHDGVPAAGDDRAQPGGVVGVAAGAGQSEVVPTAGGHPRRLGRTVHRAGPQTRCPPHRVMRALRR